MDICLNDLIAYAQEHGIDFNNPIYIKRDEETASPEFEIVENKSFTFGKIMILW